MRIHIVATMCVLYLSQFYNFTKEQFVLLIITCVTVISAEMMNTAIEVVIDKVSPGYSALAKVGKDVAAGAVFVTAVAAVIIGVILFWDIEKFKIIFEFFTGDIWNLAMLIAFACLSYLFIAKGKKRNIKGKMKNPKSVFVAIAGRPNAGKSTLTNYLVGEKIAIVSDKPQTTRTRINGVLTKGETQYVFIDTPGMHKAKNKLSDQMLKSIRESVTDVDVILMMADATKKISPIEHNLIDSFKDRKTDVVLLINKVDLVKDKSELLSLIKEYSELYDFKEIIPISVRQRIGVEEIMPVIDRYVKLSPHYFDDELPTDQAEKVWLAGIVRVRQKPNGKEIVDIGIVIVCEKASHKGMIIGKQGSMLKKIGSEAREDMQDYFGCKVNMQIWVKVKEDWRNRESDIADFGLKAD